MNCPSCKAKKDSKVIDSRPLRNRIRRRRECLACGERFTTVEHVIADPDFDAITGIMARLETIHLQAGAALRQTREMQGEIETPRGLR